MAVQNAWAVFVAITVVAWAADLARSRWYRGRPWPLPPRDAVTTRASPIICNLAHSARWRKAGLGPRHPSAD